LQRSVQSEEEKGSQGSGSQRSTMSSQRSTTSNKETASAQAKKEAQDGGGDQGEDEELFELGLISNMEPELNIKDD
jgi:hypothetical protein